MQIHCGCAQVCVAKLAALHPLFVRLHSSLVTADSANSLWQQRLQECVNTAHRSKHIFVVLEHIISHILRGRLSKMAHYFFECGYHVAIM